MSCVGDKKGVKYLNVESDTNIQFTLGVGKQQHSHSLTTQHPTTYYSHHNTRSATHMTSQSKTTTQIDLNSERYTSTPFWLFSYRERKMQRVGNERCLRPCRVCCSCCISDLSPCSLLRNITSHHITSQFLCCIIVFQKIPNKIVEAHAFASLRDPLCLFCREQLPSSPKRPQRLHSTVFYA